MTDLEKKNKIEELKKKISETKAKVDEYNAMQLALKLIINGGYGAFANAAFFGFNSNIANAITAQGRDIIKYMEKVNDNYWYKHWHNDTELHKKLGITDVKKIDKSEPVSSYIDTDSCDKDTIITLENRKITIESLYNEYLEKHGSGDTTLKGHESVSCDDKILNYSENNKLYFAPVKRLIRHQVFKPKWKLKTKFGKEIIVTNDHSMIVFRNGVQLTIKPSEILTTDKILIIK